MSVIEDLFEKFDSGEVRLAEQEVTGKTTDANGKFTAPVEQLVAVEEVVAVLTADGSGNYTTLYEGAGDEEMMAATGTPVNASEENTVEVTAYRDNADGQTETLTDGDSASNVKIIARGY